MADTSDPVRAELAAIKVRSQRVWDRRYRADSVNAVVAASTDVPRLLAALDAVLALHARQEAPTRCWDLDLRCKAHYVTTDPIPAWESVRDCPDCTYRERHYCTHCDHSEYPCPTVQAITRELTGGEAADD